MKAIKELTQNQCRLIAITNEKMNATNKPIKPEILVQS